MNINASLNYRKKAIRIIHMARYSSHTDPLFKKIRSLKFKDLFELNILKFYYKLMNNNLPDYFLHLNKVTGAQTHSYNTRFKNNNGRQIQLRHEFRRKCLYYEIARIAKNTPPNILEKVYTHSYNGFILYIKSHMLKMYPDDCHLENCYICSRQ